MTRFLSALLLSLLVSVPAFAQAPTLIPMKSTPDNAVPSAATRDFVIMGGPADWVWIKNDCAAALAFNLDGGGTKGTTNDYVIRLAQNQSFEGFFRVHTLSASNSGATACTFSFQPARK